MTKYTRWSGRLAISLWALSVGSLALAGVGCGEVKKCEKGTEGCLDGEPFRSGPNEGKCSFGLVVNNNNNTCVEDDGSEPNGDGSVPTSCTGCAADEVCSPEDGETCLSYCDVEPELRAVNPPATCRDYTGSTVKLLPFATACENACLQYCKRAEIYCPGFVCDLASCKSPAQMAVCATECPTGDPTCIALGCEEIRDTSCADFSCPNDTFAKSCTDVRCTDSCTGNTKDGFCDDGEPLSASYDICTFGSDCADCGPRKGTKGAIAPLGGQCVRDVGCPGFDSDFNKTESWCVNVTGTPPSQYACIPNCTGSESDPNACTEGFACQGLEYSDGTPFVNSSNLQAFGCFPQVCQ